MDKEKVAGHQTPLGLGDISRIAEGLARIDAGFSSVTRALAESGCQEVLLYRKICLLREKFDQLVSRLQLTICIKGDSSVL